jgi:hypothetical protein
VSKLPADVRLRAATAGWTAWVENSSDEELAWRAVADAVAEVLAGATHGGLTCKEVEDLNDDITGQLNDVGYGLHRLGYKIDLKERDDVGYWAYEALRQSKTERDALKAALTEIGGGPCANYDGGSVDCLDVGYEPACPSCNARAVLYGKKEQ